MFSVLVFLIGFLAAFQSGDAADFTAWSSPSAIASKDGTTTAQTFPESATTVSITYTATGGVDPVTYSINTQPATNHFEIVGTTGVLSLASGKSLDYETAQSFKVVIYATDSTPTTPFVASATTIITITDVNDAPTFNPTTYSGSVADAAAAGTSVNTVTAADTDGSGNVITYSIVSGSCDKFSINSSTGLISVATGQTLASATNCYILVVHAIDSPTTGKLTGTTTVTVLVGSTTTAQCTSATAITCNSATAITASAMTLLLALVMMLK